MIDWHRETVKFLDRQRLLGSGATNSGMMILFKNGGVEAGMGQSRHRDGEKFCANLRDKLKMLELD
jgi:hypothetical protein